VRLDAPGPPVVAFAVSRRQGPAVVRNRIRRRLRAAVALHEAQLSPGWAYLLSTDRRAMSAPFTELTDDIGAVLRQAREESA